MNTEPRDIDHEAQERLKRTENKQRDVMAALPEAPAQARDDGARHEGKADEAGDMVSVGQVGAAYCLCREKMPEQAAAKENWTAPDPAAASCACDGDCARRFHCTSVGWEHAFKRKRLDLRRNACGTNGRRSGEVSVLPFPSRRSHVFGDLGRAGI